MSVPVVLGTNSESPGIGTILKKGHGGEGPVGSISRARR